MAVLISACNCFLSPEKGTGRSEEFALGVSLQTVRTTRSGLESIGAIRKEGEPKRDGTRYRMLVPDEIEACRKFSNFTSEPKKSLGVAMCDAFPVGGADRQLFQECTSLGHGSIRIVGREHNPINADLKQ
jgi:hypothetical protein